MKFKRRKIAFSALPFSSFIFPAAALFAGIVAGSLMIGLADENTQTALRAYALALNMPGQTGSVLLNGMLLSLITYGALFLLSTSVYGYWLIPTVPFMKGLSYGYTASFFYAAFGTKAILGCLIGLVPQMLISSALLVLISAISADRCTALRKQSPPPSAVSTVLLYGGAFLLCFIISFLDLLLPDCAVNLMIR